MHRKEIELDLNAVGHDVGVVLVVGVGAVVVLIVLVVGGRLLMAIAGALMPIIGIGLVGFALIALVVWLINTMRGSQSPAPVPYLMYLLDASKAVL